MSLVDLRRPWRATTGASLAEHLLFGIGMATAFSAVVVVVLGIVIVGEAFGASAEFGGVGKTVLALFVVIDDGILADVPVIAVFFGIIIRMFYREHEPEHFHAEHQGQHGKFDFDGNLIVGSITSKTALKLIREWARLHRSELEANWAKMKARKPLDRIAPLE